MPDGAGGLAQLPARLVRLPRQWWAQQSLRARLTLLATALFSFAVVTGAVLLLFIQRYALTRVLDQDASRAAGQVAAAASPTGAYPKPLQVTAPGITGVQVVDRADRIIVWWGSVDRVKAVVDPDELAGIRAGDRPTIIQSPSGLSLRVFGLNQGPNTILVYTDVSRVNDSLRLLTRAALIGSPLAVLVMALASYGVITLSLRPVAALRHGAADITAAGLAKQRLPLPSAQDEIHRLAVTLNAMLDRIDTATSRQRTFVGDAAHELRSPLASVRVQLEVGQRLGPAADWSALIDDVLVDVDRLDRLVADLLTLARLDESGRLTRREPIALNELTASVVKGYEHARVPVQLTAKPAPTSGDVDALRRVAINLINNAARYAHTTVQVTVEPTTRDGRPYAQLVVEDDGPGIAPHERERVFDRFYRVQESRSRETGGTGLGLPIVRDIVRNHGGRVWLEGRSEGRAGLRAVVILPQQPPAGTTP